MIKRIALICAALSILSGCASVTGSPNQSMSVETHEQSGKQVSGAACELTNNKGKWFVTTPGSVMIHRSNDDIQVLCNKDGYESGRAAVVSDTKGSMFGNIILGGGIGAIIDHNNGSAYEYPALIQVLMGAFTKIEAPKQQSSTDGQQSINTDPKPQAPTPTQTTTAPQVVVAVTSPQYAEVGSKTAKNKEERLKELKDLYEKGLVTESAYTDQQQKILSSEN